jgi:hypothetical protein
METFSPQWRMKELDDMLVQLDNSAETERFADLSEGNGFRRLFVSGFYKCAIATKMAMDGFCNVIGDKRSPTAEYLDITFFRTEASNASCANHKPCINFGDLKNEGDYNYTSPKTKDTPDALKEEFLGNSEGCPTPYESQYFQVHQMSFYRLRANKP